MQAFIDELKISASEPVAITAPVRDEMSVKENDVVVEPQGFGRRIALLAVLLGAIGVAGHQMGYLDELEERFVPVEPGYVSVKTVEDEVEAPVEEDEPLISPTEDSENLPEPVADVISTESDSPVESDLSVEPESSVELDSLIETPIFAETFDEALVVEMEEEFQVEAPPPLVDFSLLPRPTAEIRIRNFGVVAKSTIVTLREGRAPATIDLIREDVESPLTLRLVEVDYSGNRSPWGSGQFSVAEGDFIEFPAGQDHARITLSMTSDRIREADQYSTLRVRGVEPITSELATIRISLEDDDQRAFEATLPPNTVGFAVSQISVRERDPAVQIDILRMNPDNTRLVVGFVLRDITATQGEDYFPPGKSTIEFGPGQRTAKLLIPLVQDFVFEDNEAFAVELSSADINADIDVFFRTAVIIRDDDS